MNEAAKLVSESALGLDFKTILIGNKCYSFYPPTIKTLYRALSCFARVGVEGEYTRLDVIKEVPENTPYLIKGLSVLLTGDIRGWKRKARRMEKVLESATLKELRQIMETAVSLIGGDDFFVCAALARSVAKMAATRK